jgi:hypothetical protein
MAGILSRPALTRMFGFLPVRIRGRWYAALGLLGVGLRMGFTP